MAGAMVPACPPSTLLAPALARAARVILPKCHTLAAGWAIFLPPKLARATARGWQDVDD